MVKLGVKQRLSWHEAMVKLGVKQ